MVTHLSGFKTSLTRTLNSIILKNNPKDKIDITGEDTREGITAIISVKMPDPKFSSQTKDKLVSSEVKGIVETLVSSKLKEYLDENPKDLKSITAKIYQAAKAREEARKAKELIRRKDPPSIGNLPGKLLTVKKKTLLNVSFLLLRVTQLAVQLNKLETGKRKQYFHLKVRY